MERSRLRQVGLLVASTLLLSGMTLELPDLQSPQTISEFQLTIGTEAYARRSGGRAGGGSFRRSPSSSGGSRSPSNRSSGGSSNRNSGSSNYNRNSNRDYRGGGTTVIPVPVGPRNSYYGNGGYSTTSSGGDWIVGLILLGVSTIVIVMIAYYMIRALRGLSGGSDSGNRVVDNDIVTVSKIQVALLAEARSVQSELTSISLGIDTDTPEGLLQLLQESALALLRTPENWSHVLASSQTVRSREEAETLFSKLSIAERSKFGVETLTNVGGRVHQRSDFRPNPDADPAAYIVVTLLVGTAHDQPLFGEIRTTAALKQALEQLASVPSEYLMVFELLWSPQDASDSLTYDELLTEYTDMVQI
ncbi:DUF1517 domain-containing protein [Pantanalinema rosaneae CENA516]|uniref:DUF1517 domain-containing protein n=1 Tax=Pantanalinema rosaneae TaxID=1620701 RepID=UPI003D6F97A3